MRLIDDFKKFAFKGNVVDLAVGVVIGAAFGKIVTALVSDLVMPLVALVLPSGDWRASGYVLRKAADPKDDVILKYGDFLGSVVDFLVVALVLFFVISKLVQGTKERIAPKEKPAETTKRCKYCLETVPIGATRCRACTSDLVDAEPHAA
jgi:large conductance mechanosensitive channel